MSSKGGGISISPEGLSEEIRAAEAATEDKLKPYWRMIEEYAPGQSSKAKGKGGGDGNDDVENLLYVYLASAVPQIVWNNPRLRVSTKRHGSQREVAKALEAAMNRWVVYNEYRDTAVKLCYDFLLKYGVALVTEEPMPGMTPLSWVMEGVPRWPQVHRIPPERYFHDPRALSPLQARFRGHKVVRSKALLLQEAKDNPDAGWNVKLIKTLSEDVEIVHGERRPDGPARDEICFNMVHVPGYQLPDAPGPDEGHNGTLFFVITDNGHGAEGKDVNLDAFIREPQPFFGPASGPYSLGSVYYVPSESIGYSPAEALRGQRGTMRALLRAESRRAKKHKRGLFISDRHKKTAQSIQDSEDDFVMAVPNAENLQNDIVERTFGGLDAATQAAISFFRDGYERSAGMASARQGQSSGAATATEVAVADQATTVRLEFIRSQFTEWQKDIFQKVGFYMYHDDEVVMPLGDAEFNDGEGNPYTEPWFVGGHHEAGSGATFQDLVVDIEPYSLAYTDEGLKQRRALQANQLMMQAIQLAGQPPFNLYPWKLWAESMENALNLEGFSEQFGDYMDNLAREGGGIQHEDPKRPKMKRDAGIIGSLMGELGGGPPTAPGQGLEQSSGLQGQSTGAQAFANFQGGV